MAGFIGSGDIYIRRRDPVSGLMLGWSEKLYGNRFELQASAEIRELISKGRSDYGIPIGSVSLQQPATFNMTLREPDPDAMALLFLGDVQALTDAGGAVTAEAAIASGALIRTAKPFSAVSAVTSSPTGTTYVAGVDYAIQSGAAGLIRVLPGSSLATAIAADSDGSLPVLVTYTSTVQAGKRVLGGTRPSVRAHILFDGVNQESGKATICEIWDALLTPDSGFDLLGDDWAEVPLGGRMNKPADKPSAFEFRYPQG